MALHGGYFKQMYALDHYPTRELNLDEYLPDVLNYAKGGVDFVIDEQLAINALRSIQRDEQLEQKQNEKKFGLGGQLYD